jgi:aspartate kinase
LCGKTRSREGEHLSDSAVSQTVVVKLGGSIFVSDDSYREAAAFFVGRLRKCVQDRFLAVVSARNGLTDELERLAQRITGNPDSRTLDLLWATGEMRSVALLTLHLQDMGIAAVGLNIHETGLRLDGVSNESPGIEVIPQEIERALHEYSVVVVPGFFGTHDGGVIASLGRGGSDLSAVLLADELDASQCELIKDVSGYFTTDPSVDPAAEHLPNVSYERAIAMADDGCELVQRKALEAARLRRLRLVIRTLDHMAPTSIVS